jgi:hypothetical protein
MESPYLYEIFNESHYAKFNLLYQNAFKKNMEWLEFRRRFDTLSRGFEFIGYIAIHGQSGEAAAFYGVFPLKMKVGESVLAAAVSGDTMTHTNHRNKGLFRALATLTYEKCRKLGVAIIYGFPNSQSYHGLVHSLNWKHVNELHVLDLSLRFKISPVHKIIKHVGFLQILFVKFAHYLLKKYVVTGMDSFNNGVDEKYGIVYRDRDYIAHKGNGKRMFLKIGDQIVWIRLAELLWIGDFSDMKNIKIAEIAKLKKITRLLGYNTIRFAINKEVLLPDSMNSFKVIESIPTCMLYLGEGWDNSKFLFTPADFDTW